MKRKQYEIDYDFKKKSKKFKNKYFKAHDELFMNLIYNYAEDGDGKDATNHTDNTDKNNMHQRMADTISTRKMGAT